MAAMYPGSPHRVNGAARTGPSGCLSKKTADHPMQLGPMALRAHWRAAPVLYKRECCAGA
eukprot:CAMPEP_0175272310 /NCGR_PEP_ID=MMETSP0093-20121207/46357_1 /TAXON_ID=311494 /ORGANISM="Alexandrium monilatum, Strain CCMP3105" /LENGTH=59 /DNA_ID=CAMNT_0016567091 /DNA_START=15 /DNA_END=191 /DNA_ORIENTATION=-